MILIFHIAIAIATVVYATYLFFNPSESKFKMAYLLLGTTIASGTYLIITKPAHMVQTCIEGLIYVGLVSTALIFAARKLKTKHLLLPNEQFKIK